MQVCWNKIKAFLNNLIFAEKENYSNYQKGAKIRTHKLLTMKLNQ
jgi:hypothetical protein